MNEAECLALFEKYKLLFNSLLKYLLVFERMYCFDCASWIIARIDHWFERRAICLVYLFER